MTHRVYAHEFRGDIQECFAGSSRWECQRWLNSIRKAGRMTHFYFISSLDPYAAKKRYARD